MRYRALEVAPRRGAWIETVSCAEYTWTVTSRAPQGRVD